MKKFFQILLNKKHTVLFLLAISLPLLFLLTGTGKVGSIRERKNKAPGFFSGEGIQKGLKKFENYFEKNFPFRKELLFKRSYLYSRYLGVSPVNRVIIGKNNWLFLKWLNETGSEINYSISKDKFRKDELEYWFNIFNEKYQFLQKRGINFLIVIVPNKSTVYPEHLPENIRKVTGGVRAKQLTDYFFNNSDIQVLNLKDLFLSKKTEHQIYHRTDSHWTHYGAWLAYREILLHLSQKFRGMIPIPFENFPKKRIAGPSKADLASMLSLNKSLYSEKFKRLFTPDGITIGQLKLKYFKFKKGRISYFQNESGILPKAIMIHDSFGRGLKKFMSSSFSEIVFIRVSDVNFFPDLIAREKPSVVIYEIAERFFYRPVNVHKKNSKK